MGPQNSPHTLPPHGGAQVGLSWGPLQVTQMHGGVRAKGSRGGGPRRQSPAPAWCPCTCHCPCPACLPAGSWKCSQLKEKPDRNHREPCAHWDRVHHAPAWHREPAACPSSLASNGGAQSGLMGTDGLPCAALPCVGTRKLEWAVQVDSFRPAHSDPFMSHTHVSIHSAHAHRHMRVHSTRMNTWHTTHKHTRHICNKTHKNTHVCTVHWGVAYMHV